MKKTHSAKKSAAADADMLAEYHFDYRKARPNRFARSAIDSGRP